MDELGHTYIPKVLPGSSSHEISSPTVGYLMSHYLINKKKKLMCIHIYIYIFSTLLPWRNLWNTSHSKAPRFPLWNYNKRQFIIAPFKGISTMLTEPFLHVRFRSTQKRLLHKSSKSLLSKTEMSSVSSKAKEAISCRPLGKGGGGTKRRITFQSCSTKTYSIYAEVFFVYS